jgi:tRNA pseudouridine38-40 synthase
MQPKPLRRIKLTIEYDGSCYHGWQIQSNAHTVQSEIEDAIFKITGEKVRVTGSGRTDAGVHALGQVAHFDTGSVIPADKFKDALSAVLPASVAVIGSEEVDFSFHSRYSATGKTYEYKIINRPIRSPIMEKRSWHIRETLNFKALRQASEIFVGTHDFSSFCASGRVISDFNRRIFLSEWNKQKDLLIYRVTGNGFLYNMVRIMVGTMIEVGLGKRKPESILDILHGKKRDLAGITAPPQGLYLVKVHYSGILDGSR